jgi:hypothetical protein
MEIADWNRVKAATLETANLYSLTLAVFDSVLREPELATGALVLTKGGPCLLTAGHVINRFLQLGSQGRLQIGREGHVFSRIPVERISIGRRIDIASIRLTLEEAKATELPILTWSDVRPDCVEEGTLVAFVGYPGSWKRQQPTGSIGIGSYEFFGFVQTVELDQFSVRIDDRHDFALKTYAESRTFEGFSDLGGLSGAPIFQAADRPKVVGIVSEGGLLSQREQKIYAVHVSALDSGGSVRA